MDLSIYNVIIGPVISDKAYRLNKKLEQLVLKVHPKANKPLVKTAIERLFNVKVQKVNVSVDKGKNRRSRRKIITGKTVKKAFVTLKEGYTLDLFNQASVQAQKT
ncbi:50S ribosomal protein L23 [Candidatus Dependentiae bacterium]|nr:50S ribosomal protein L23 [Candidatus Dependentiae bacterium]